LVTCSRGARSTFTTMVIREICGISVCPTASDSMLNPRRVNRLATRASTPGVFSTRTERVCWLTARPPRCAEWSTQTPCSLRSQLVLLELGRHVARDLDVVVAGASRNHRPHHGVPVHDEVDHH